MRVLLADKLSPHVAEALEEAGCAVTTAPELDGDSLSEALRRLDPDVLVVRSTKVKAEHLAAGRALALVIRAGAGVNTIAMEEASNRGIYVSNCPGKNAIAVAELAMGLLLALDRRLPDNVASLRAGAWKKKEYSKARGLAGRTLAVLGTGQTGQELIRRALAFDMQVRAWSRSLTEELAMDLGVTWAESPLAACRGADALSIHLALTPETRQLVGAELLEALNPGALVVNTSRGEVLDQPALEAAIALRGLRAGLDVFAEEPAGGEAPFPYAIGQNPAVYGSHHIGASTDQATWAVGDEVVTIIQTWMSTGEVKNCVNLAAQTEATHLLVVRHKDEVGVLARVLDLLREEHVNVQEMENIIFQGGGAACARIQIAKAPSPAVLDRLDAIPAVFASSLLALHR